MPVGEGPESKVLSDFVYRNFIPVDGGIYFAKRTDRGYAFQFLNAATGDVRSFGSTRRRMDNVVTVSPDGQWFAYAQQDHAGRDIIVVDNFR